MFFGFARIGFMTTVFLVYAGTIAGSETWPQWKFDCRHSGNAAQREVSLPLGLLGAVPLTDAIFTAPAVADGRVYVVDGSGVAFAADAETMQIVWKRPTDLGRGNCNNVSSPAIAGSFLHFGTMAGSYFVLDRTSGEVVRQIQCGEPIFCSPIVANDRVYFVTLGARAYALRPNGEICWQWDFVRDQLEFQGDRFRGEDWRKHKSGRVTTADQFLCAWNPAMYDRTLVVPAGGALVWLEDQGDRPAVRHVEIARTPTLGLSIDERNAVYRQWHRLDNGGQVDILKLAGAQLQRDWVRGTRTSTRGGLLSFCSVSMRGSDVYRCRPEKSLGLCRHRKEERQPEYLGGYPSITSPILLRDQAVFGGLDGQLHIVPLAENGEAWSFETAFGRAISAPVAVCDGHVYFGCEDGYLYGLGPEGTASLPNDELDLDEVRSPLTSSFADAKYDWYTSFGDWANTNVNEQQVAPPFRMKWVRRYKGTTKHFSTCGGGRMYTHTAEGQIFAVEQETGRLLWRRYFPGVFICYTSPLYYRERLLVPQAGLERCRLRCLSAATGELLWEAPFAGSPSWNRQAPPVVHDGLVVYAFSTGTYQRDRWLVGHGEIAGFPADQKPLVKAFDLDSGKEVWTADFSEYGTGGDESGLCLMDGKLYYSCFFGYLRRRGGEPRATGVTAAIDLASGEVLWVNTQQALHSGCTISGQDGRLYLGGYSRVDDKANRVWCLNAEDGSLVWQSDPVKRAIHVITIGKRFLFTHAQYENGYLIDKQTGKILRTLTQGYKCTRFTLSEPHLLGANMDVHDLSDIENIELLSTGPAIDPSQCLGATVSNGRLFYTAHGSGLQVSQTYGREAMSSVPPWERAATEKTR